MKKRLFVFLKMVLVILLLTAQPAQAAAKVYEYYGNHLDTFNKKIYRSVVKTAKKGLGTTRVEVSSPNVSVIRGLSSYLVNDHPEIYWIKGYWTTTSYSWLEGTHLDFEPIASWNKADKRKAAFNKKVNTAVSLLKKKCSGKGAAKRAKIILDYIAAHCSYAFSAYDQTAYGVFMKKKAVCAGYARSYKLLCDRLGVTCICVEGQINGEGHMVNFVKIGKKWYYVDPTWCDIGNTANTRYFLLGRITSGCTVTQSTGIRVPALSAKDYPIAR